MENEEPDHMEQQIPRGSNSGITMSSMHESDRRWSENSVEDKGMDKPIYIVDFKLVFCFNQDTHSNGKLISLHSDQIVQPF